MRIVKLGNSPTVRLPVTMAAAHVANQRDELLKRLRAVRGRLPSGFTFSRGEANAR